MQYIHLEVFADEGYIKATALDGYKISVEYAKAQAGESFKCLIKPCIPKISKQDRHATLELTGDKCFVTVGDQITGYIQPAAKYYDVENTLKITDETPKETVCIDAQYLKEAAESTRGVYGLGRVSIDIYGKNKPVVIRTDWKNDLPDNIKLVSPIKTRD